MTGPRARGKNKGGRGNVIDLAGRTFGLLRVLRRLTPEEVEALPQAPQTAAYWLVRCQCGAEKPVVGASLRRCATRSCGAGPCRGQL